MKYVLGVWATPLILFWGWYFLSLNDIHFGYVLMTRQAHDLIFQLYGEMIGLDPETIPTLVAQACIIDTGLILAIWAFRRRKAIFAWVQEKRGVNAGSSALAERVDPVEHALQDEGGRGRIDAGLAFAPRNVHFEQRPFGRYGREALVPEGER